MYQIKKWSIVFASSFMISFSIVNIWPIYQSLDKRTWFFFFFFFIPKWVPLCSKFWFFAKLWLILSQLELSKTELPKCTPRILMENYDHITCPVLLILFYMTQRVMLGFFKKLIFELEASYRFKTTCILVRQVISLKKLVVLSAKFIV